jgi:hypothetical protein
MFMGISSADPRIAIRVDQRHFSTPFVCRRGDYPLPCDSAAMKDVEKTLDGQDCHLDLVVL